jgi:signal transduction histidine kinase/CheY-like chemotaxis protein
LLLGQQQLLLLPGVTDWASASDARTNNFSEIGLVGEIPLEAQSAWLHLDMKDSEADILYFPSNSFSLYRVFSDTKDSLLFEQRDPKVKLANWNPQANIPLSRSWGNSFFLQLETNASTALPIETDTAAVVRFSFLDFAEYEEIKSAALINNGMYYGAILLMSVFSLLLSAFNRDPDAWKLGITLLTWFVAVFSVWGYGSAKLPFGIQDILLSTSNQALALATFTSAWFCQSFLAQSASGFWAFKLLRGCMWGSLFYLLGSLFIGISWEIAILLMLATGTCSVLTSISAARNGDKAANYLLGASASSALPFAFLSFAPLSQQSAIASGMVSLIFIMLALMQRVGVRFHNLGLQAKNASERERFLASMSHEIRTPLNGIIGFSELCSQEKLEGDTKYYFDQIDRSSKMLLGIVNDVLDYSKLQASEVNLIFEPMSVKSTLEDVITINKPFANLNSIALDYEISDDVSEYIITDPYRCAQVLINLCGNAVKFSRNGHVKIKVTLDKNHILFAVIDNGIGIEKDLLAGLFNPFYQADASTARRFGGTGLGLAISKQLSQLLEGELTAVSEKGKGSTFTFRLPYSEGTPPKIPAKADISKLIGKRVLLAEDNAVNLLLATRILEKNGLLVDSAENGKIALRKASINDYDFILMDMQMPVLSGTEATEQIRNTGFMQPIIAMTANTTDSDKEACFSSGMNDYLTKPIEQQQLLKTLEIWSTVV